VLPVSICHVSAIAAGATASAVAIAAMANASFLISPSRDRPRGRSFCTFPSELPGQSAGWGFSFAMRVPWCVNSQGETFTSGFASRYSCNERSALTRFHLSGDSGKSGALFPDFLRTESPDLLRVQNQANRLVLPKQAVSQPEKP